MGALAQAAIVSEKLKAILPSAPSAYTRSVTDVPTGPPRSNPYREALQRRAMRRQLARAEAEGAQLKDAVSDLLSAAMNVALASTRIANGEVKPPAIPQPIEQTVDRSFDRSTLMPPSARPALGKSVSPTSATVPPSAEPAADAPPSFVGMKQDRETVAPGMVTFHGGMSIPRVAPFIFGVSNEPERPQDEE